MTRLDAALDWYKAKKRYLMAISDCMRDRPPVSAQLLPLIGAYLDKTNGREIFRREQADVEREALVRLFAGFEADFRDGYAIWLQRVTEIARPDPTPARIAETIRATLPDSIEQCLKMFRALEPRFHGSEKNWLDKLRAYRNDVMHSGFAPIEPKEDPMEAYLKLKRILSYLELS